jgi:hypothetical protein
MKNRKNFWKSLWLLPLIVVVFGGIHALSQVQGETADESVLPAELSPDPADAGDEAGETAFVREYHRSGHARSVFSTQGGRRHGLSLHFYESGNVWKTEMYCRGEKSGPFAVFYDGGGLKCHGNMADSRPHGQVTHYKPDRTVNYDEVFENGVSVGRHYH